MINIKKFTFNAFHENTFVLFDETKECVVIDPGCNDRSEEMQLVDFIKQNDLTPKILLNTHCHIDHIMGNKFVTDTFGVPLLFNKIENAFMEATVAYAIACNIDYTPSPAANDFLTEADVVKFGESELAILFVPGHSPGHIAFVCKEQKFVIGGDVLFQGSIGRTDLPGGDFSTLINSIKTKFLTLSDDFQVYPGHGPATNIAFEKTNNPFLS